MYGLSVVVPVYRSELILPELVQRLEDVLRKASSRYELVLVNDCSTGFTTLPLQPASLIGFGLTLFGLGVLGWVLLSYCSYGGTVPGFPFRRRSSRCSQEPNSSRWGSLGSTWHGYIAPSFLYRLYIDLTEEDQASVVAAVTGFSMQPQRASREPTRNPQFSTSDPNLK